MPGILFYKGQSHQLKTDEETSSRYWSIRSEKMSFTYFEVPPNTIFEKHKHFSEQITYLLDRALFFEADGTTYCLKPKAMDSWARASEQY